MFLVYYFLSFILGTAATLDLDTLSPSQSLRDGKTLVSTGGNFELGFFSPPNSTKRYLGIGSTTDPDRTVVWVANRETSLADRSGILNVTHQGKLVLLDGTNRIIWSSNTSRTTKYPVVQLLDSGNLVVRDENDRDHANVLWQSFDHPCDNLLPGMKLGVNFITGIDTFLSSWKSTEDPAPGQFSLRIDPRGFPQILLKNGSAIQYRAGSWNGVGFTGTPPVPPTFPVCDFQFVLNENEVYFKCEAKYPIDSRVWVNQTGFTQRLIRSSQRNGWILAYQAPTDKCDMYSFCGANAYCKSNGTSVCACLEEFVPKSTEEWNMSDWTNGCVRKTPLICNKGHKFINHARLKLPDTSNSWFNSSISLEECEEKCVRNCSCTAYSNLDIRNGTGCLLWFGDLMDMRELFYVNQALYVRMAAAASESGQTLKWIEISVPVAASFPVVLVSGIIFFIRWRRLRIEAKFLFDIMSEAKELEIDGKKGFNLKVYRLSSIKLATNNFSSENKLGEGGFGPVYKGLFTDGQEIAIKRLSGRSKQGLVEFKNELIIIAKLQHTNLVRLLGFCIHRKEKILVYEYMPNKSLDTYIFDESKRKLFDWNKYFNIIEEITQGLLYLHKYSRLKIIHRDLKASNILLDKNMNIKISDFGMAKIFTSIESEAKTNRVVGTRGYMAPEYAISGVFSEKSDVFSFGILVLEIISGRRSNSNIIYNDQPLNLVGYAWQLWNEGVAIQLMNSTLRDSCSEDQILRCINLALLCVEHNPLDRPTISAAISMFTSEGVKLPFPKQPAFSIDRKIVEDNLRGINKTENSTINNLTISVMDPR